MCLITANHIATHPRLVKEAAALEAAGYFVHIVFTQYDKVCTALDQEIIAKHPSWTYDVLCWTGDSFKGRVRRIVSGGLQKMAAWICNWISSDLIYAKALNRHLHWQIKKAIAARADLYLAHGLAALPVACNAAVTTGGAAGFDAEDYHRAENCNNLRDRNVVIRIAVEDCYIPQVQYFTAASPLIAKAYKTLYPNCSPKILLNVFSKKDVQPLQFTITQPIKLFWFSQTIGTNRGLETVIKAMGICKSTPLELHLLGKSTTSVRKYFFQLASSVGLSEKVVRFYDIVSEPTLFAMAARFDIGLALETGMPYNRDICLTNKIFTYIQAGLAVIASNTSAQRLIIEQYPSAGLLYQQGSETSLAAILDDLARNLFLLNNIKAYNWALGQEKLNWEVEQQVILREVAAALDVTRETTVVPPTELETEDYIVASNSNF